MIINELWIRLKIELLSDSNFMSDKIRKHIIKNINKYKDFDYINSPVNYHKIKLIDRIK